MAFKTFPLYAAERVWPVFFLRLLMFAHANFFANRSGGELERFFNSGHEHGPVSAPFVTGTDNWSETDLYAFFVFESQLLCHTASNRFPAIFQQTGGALRDLHHLGRCRPPLHPAHCRAQRGTAPAQRHQSG